MYKPRTSPLAQILKEYRLRYGITQEQLASELTIDARTLRRYENGESVLTDINELRRIASVLGIDSEHLGVLSAITTPDEIDTAVDHIWQVLKLARFGQASLMVDSTLQSAIDLTKANTTDDMLRKLAHAQFVTAYVKNHTTRVSEMHIPLRYYNALEQTARMLQDDTLLNIALAYQGDMMQRSGDVNCGIKYLEEARDTTPLADLSARGNGIQLLGRAYFKVRRLDDFDRAMHNAEELAHQLSSNPASAELSNSASSTRGQFNVATVYEEWGKSLGIVGKTNEAMDYLDKADRSFSLYWTQQRKDLLLKSARAIALVHGGDVDGGMKLSIECIDLCHRYVNVRTIERIYGIGRYLDTLSRRAGSASATIREALDGPIEY